MNNINTHHPQPDPAEDLVVRLRHGPTDYCPILHVPVVDECSFDLPEEEMRPSKTLSARTAARQSPRLQVVFPNYTAHPGIYAVANI